MIEVGPILCPVNPHALFLSFYSPISHSPTATLSTLLLQHVTLNFLVARQFRSILGSSISAEFAYYCYYVSVLSLNLNIIIYVIKQTPPPGLSLFFLLPFWCLFFFFFFFFFRLERLFLLSLLLPLPWLQNLSFSIWSPLQRLSLHEDASGRFGLVNKVALLLLLALSNAVTVFGEESNGQCDYKPAIHPRPHSVSIKEFGAVGDGKTLNTIAFQNAIFYLKSFADKGGAQLYVPPGKWLTGSINLTSHLTLFLEKGAVILGSQDPSHWEVVDPLPSYGRGTELPGGRYRSLINGNMLEDVVITGDNGTIDGQGSVWWDWFNSHSLNHSRPHLVEFISCEYVIVSNLTFLNAPANNIHPVYCSHVLVQNISISAPPESPYTSGIVPDSSSYMCIENCSIYMGYDAIAIKSGWDEYGIAYGRPTTDVHIRRVHLQSSSGSCIAFGSEMSGGISNVHVEEVHLYSSFSGIEFRTTKGRGGYIKHIIISDIEIQNINKAFGAIGDCGTHPDDSFDPNALPVLQQITLQDVVGTNITAAGNFTGIEESPFTSICLFNVSLITSATPASWVCSNIIGYSESVSPQPCPELQILNSSSSAQCYTLVDSYGKSAAL